MSQPPAVPPAELPPEDEVTRVLSELERRWFGSATHARLLDADVTAGVLSVVAWQGGPRSADPAQVIGHRTHLGLRLVECGGDLDAVLMDVLRCQVHEPSASGWSASGDEPGRLLECYPEATWYG